MPAKKEGVRKTSVPATHLDRRTQESELPIALLLHFLNDSLILTLLTSPSLGSVFHSGLHLLRVGHHVRNFCLIAPVAARQAFVGEGFDSSIRYVTAWSLAIEEILATYESRTGRNGLDAGVMTTADVFGDVYETHNVECWL